MDDLSDKEIEDLEALLLQQETDPTKKVQDNLSDQQNDEKLAEIEKKLKSLIHAGDTDSSDEEEEKNCLQRKYNNYGTDIHKAIKTNEYLMKEKHISKEIDNLHRNDDINNKTSSFEQKSLTVPSKFYQNTQTPDKSNVYVDPVFGMKIARPLVSSSVLKERMTGRIAISIPRIRKFLETNDLKSDWVVAGVILSKSAVKTSKKGASYTIWKLSDLKGEIKNITLFLFQTAYKELWKTQEGTVIAVLNPSVFDRRDEKNSEACLSVDTSQKVMILGISKDLGKCRSKKKNGEPCPAIVNLSECEFCVYHVQQAYGTASKRSEFQSITAGRGLHDLRNKVLGKNEVFYGGQMYTAVRATKNPKQIAKDQNRLMKLSDYYQSPFSGENSLTNRGSVRKPVTYAQNKSSEVTASSVELSFKQRSKDIERLQALGISSSQAGPPSTPLQCSFNKTNAIAPRISTSPLASQSSLTKKSPQTHTFSFDKKNARLSGGPPTTSIDSSQTHLIKLNDFAKTKALEALKKKPMEKANPNFIKYRGSETGKKRALEEIIKKVDETDPIVKKQKLDEEAAKKEKQERIKKVMAMTSSHVDLLVDIENEEQEKYFSNLEKKEAMEEKMMNTYKIACKAVICSQCKYMAFSASARCKEEKHPLRVVDGEKRFFKCGDCGNRTVTLFRIPKMTCKNCSSSKWERASMMKDRRVGVGEQLSIRGDEETFIGSVSTKGGNLNLLVPDD